LSMDVCCSVAVTMARANESRTATIFSCFACSSRVLAPATYVLKFYSNSFVSCFNASTFYISVVISAFTGVVCCTRVSFSRCSVFRSASCSSTLSLGRGSGSVNESHAPCLVTICSLSCVRAFFYDFINTSNAVTLSYCLPTSGCLYSKSVMSRGAHT
jgi:hypothetical protein